VPTTDPRHRDPAGTGPAGSEPAGTEPAVTALVGTEPAVTALVGTEPAVTALVGTEPAVTALVGTEPAVTDLGTRLLACRDAEDYFAVLDVPFDPQVLRVNRLHVLRLFGPALQEYLAAPADAEGQAAGEAAGRLRAALAAAHEAFTQSTALDHRLFKVLQDHTPRGFVPLDGVTVEDLAPSASVQPVVTR
jgi:nitrogenase-stabilizing/protective protein